MKFDIEKASERDVDNILNLNKELFMLEVKSGFDSSLDPNWADTEEAKKEIFDRVTQDDSCSFVVRVDNEIVGYLIGLILEEETGRNESKYAELEHMFVKEELRGEGVGKSLVDSFREWSREKELKKLKVNVSFKNQKAIDFYKKIGLEQTDITLVEIL